jgi:hypothetical protein
MNQVIIGPGQKMVLPVQEAILLPLVVLVEMEE